MKGLGGDYEIVFSYCLPMSFAMRVGRAVRINVDETSPHPTKSRENSRVQREPFISDDKIRSESGNPVQDLALQFSLVGAAQKAVNTSYPLLLMLREKQVLVHFVKIDSRLAREGFFMLRAHEPSQDSPTN